MPKISGKKITTVHEHPRRVRSSSKNPDGVTIVDQHTRRVLGAYFDRDNIGKTYQEYSRKEIQYPGSGKLPQENADAFDEQIAVWTDFFNKTLKVDPPMDPDMIKALIASESDFKVAARTKVAIGIMQITKDTLKILQDPKAEAREFIFGKIRQKDLESPEISIPMGIRWLAWKQARAQSKLGRPPTNEEIILEYKGLLKSKTKWAKNALEKYRKSYEMLKKK